MSATIHSQMARTQFLVSLAQILRVRGEYIALVPRIRFHLLIRIFMRVLAYFNAYPRRKCSSKNENSPGNYIIWIEMDSTKFKFFREIRGVA